MLWKLPPSVRPLLIAPRRHRCLSTYAFPPLRLLFCGSDDFSIASLRALQEAKTADQNLIESIEVVHRPEKRTGRGYKVIKEVPLAKFAKECKLDTYKLAGDSFTRWTPPRPFDMVIAVSFGLFVPPRILSAATFGGLNVHPSLLPDLRGPAPIQHTLLKRRAKTGVTVQTLDTKEFDNGTIVAQTPPPGVDVPDGATCADLRQQLGELGAQMLVHVLKTGRFLPPLEPAGWYKGSGGPISYADKIKPEHRHVDFSTTRARDIMTRHNVLGDLWFVYGKGHERFIIHEMRVLDADDEQPDLTPGEFARGDSEAKTVVVGTADGRLIEIQNCTCGGGKISYGNRTLRRRIREIREDLDRRLAGQ